jgi:hypothetical protein
MGRTLTVRIDDELDAWLAATAKKQGVSNGKLVRDQLEMTRANVRERPFMRLAGAISGARTLSGPKGFSKG